MAMLRLRPIRPAKRRGPPREVLRVADAAFWMVFACAILLGAGQVAAGVPLLMGMFFGPGVIAAQASVKPHDVVKMLLSPDEAGDAIPLLRSSLAGDSDEAGPRFPPSFPPRIAIVIDDLGTDVVSTHHAIALPRRVALAFLPYPQEAPALAREAGRAGHEVLVHVPMEAVAPVDPGPMALRTDLPASENLRRFDWALSRVPGYVGVNNHEGSLFTADRNALIPVVERLSDRHVFFFDSRTDADSQVVTVARAFGVASAARDVFLDNVATIDAVDAQLRALEKRAKEQGVAIAIGHPHEITLDAVAYWAAHESGFDLVPLREAIRLKTEHEVRISLSLAGR